MSLLDTRHKKKSFTLTTILLSVLLLLMFYIGLTYLEPPIENGITVNFGAMEFGMGEEQPTKKIKSQPVKKPPVPEEVPVAEQPVEEQETEVKESPAAESPSEKLLTQENEESIKIKQQAEAKKRADEAAKKAREEAEQIERERQAAKEKERLEQEAQTKELDALIGGVSQADGEVNGGEGDDQLAGDKGQPNGDPYATTYYGPGGGSGTGGYGLSGRSLANSGKVEQECNEAGRVVVKIVVDRNGKVVQATPGVKGTDNNDPCLLEPARKTALLHRWKPDSKAPVQQIGFVVVNFKLGE